ncbi:hypothetical protein HYR69_03410 [Candidatus Sumerlaeota bacterium]|nr:hypothetical protein [Candidatus Sumerlaeota bacterium]MBI3735850.1 hypothetical protein [Candidatus Sumerlaeota bacterium]
MKKLNFRMTACKSAFFGASALIFFLPAACALYRNDRCYVEDEDYAVAHKLFVESGSLDLVQRQLREFKWRRCEINETIYRLTKEFEVVP